MASQPPQASREGWLAAWRAVLAAEWALLRRHRRLAAAMAGVLLVPALYAFVFLDSLWDPAARTRDLPVGLVNLDAGASYRGRDLNLGRDVLAATVRQGSFAYRPYADAAAARRDVREGRLAFMLEVPADFSRQALPGERPGAARLLIYVSEGNHAASAGFARRFAPEVAQRVNTMLGEARWELVLAGAAGSQRTLESLQRALGDLRTGAGELHAGLQQAQGGSGGLAAGIDAAAQAAAHLRTGAGRVADGTQQAAQGLRSLGPALRTIDQRRPSEADLAALRTGSRALSEGHRELAGGLVPLAAGARRLELGLGTWRTEAADVPLFGATLAESAAPLQDGAAHLADGLAQATEAQARLRDGAQRLDDGVGTLVEGTQRAGAALAALTARLPDEVRIEALADGARELAGGHDALGRGMRTLGDGETTLQGGIGRLADGAARLDTGLALLAESLPRSVDSPGGSAQGLALSVQPVVEIVAPVPNNGVALTPNFVPVALWVGAVMTAFLVHLRRLPESLAALPRTALVAGKLTLPTTVVLLQALGMHAMLAGVLHMPVHSHALLALVLATASATFLWLIFAMVRVLGDIGKVLAVLLLVVQVSAAGALLPIELTAEPFQALHPWMPLTWVTRAFRVAVFGAFDGSFAPAWGMVVAIGAEALALGGAAGRWRPIPNAAWKPPLDLG